MRMLPPSNRALENVQPDKHSRERTTSFDNPLPVKPPKSTTSHGLAFVSASCIMPQAGDRGSATAEWQQRPKPACSHARVQASLSMSSTAESSSTAPPGARPPNMSICDGVIIVPVAISRGRGALPATSMRFHSSVTVLNTHTSPNALHVSALFDNEQRWLEHARAQHVSKYGLEADKLTTQTSLRCTGSYTCC